MSKDHKAFTWDPMRRRAIVPVERSCGPDAGLGDGTDGQPRRSEVRTCESSGASMARRAGRR